jgi:hypothetical protein
MPRFAVSLAEWVILCRYVAGHLRFGQSVVLAQLGVLPFTVPGRLVLPRGLFV